MALRPTLQPRLNQQLVLTPQLRKAIEILQMSHQEIRDYVESEIESNPVLERDENPELRLETEPPASDENAVDRALADPAKVAEQAPYDAAREPFDGGFNDQLPFQANGNSDEFNGLNPLENLASAQTLKDHLQAQLRLSTDEGALRDAAELIANELDNDGFLRTSLADLALHHDLSVRSLEAALTCVQACEPTGVGARTLAECFRLQLADAGALDDDVLMILSHVAEDKRLNIRSLQSLTGLADKKFDQALQKLRGLDRSPGDIFGETQIAYVVPDVVVTRRPNGEMNVELNPDAMPKVLISNQYQATISKDKEYKEFVSECMARANWLTRTLEQRSRTILKIATEVVRQQYAFFEHGAEHLKGMTMRELAERVDTHESTVSRVASSKFLHCQFGTFELRYFFSKAMPANGGGDQISSTSIQEKIRRMVAAESPHKILSDEHIAQNLRHGGINVARRTVSKYREALRIPSSTERRKQRHHSRTSK